MNKDQSKNHIITCVTDISQSWIHANFLKARKKVTYIPVDNQGIIDIESLEIYH